MPRQTEKTSTERVKELYESFAERDMEAIRGIMDSDIELHMLKRIVGGGTFNGFDEIVENVFSVLGNEWEDVSVVPDRYVADGDTVVVLLTWGGTYSETGKSVEYPAAHVFHFEDETIVQWASYTDTAVFNAALKG